MIVNKMMNTKAMKEGFSRTVQKEVQEDSDVHFWGRTLCAVIIIPPKQMTITVLYMLNDPHKLYHIKHTIRMAQLSQKEKEYLVSQARIS